MRLERDSHSWFKRALVWALLAVLVLAQASALMHRVVHGHAPSAWRVHAHAAAHADAVSTSDVLPTNKSPEFKHPLADLWGEHSQRSDCQLVDQLATVAPPLVWVALGVAAQATCVPQPVAASVALLFERFYSAQAPPALI